jgi:hypothetical protein
MKEARVIDWTVLFVVLGFAYLMLPTQDFRP